MAENDDDRYSANSEMRYITLELMKIAQKRKVPFGKVSQEFVQNAYTLAEMLQSIPTEAELKPGRKGAAGQRERQDGKE